MSAENSNQALPPVEPALEVVERTNAAPAPHQLAAAAHLLELVRDGADMEYFRADAGRLANILNATT